MLNYQNINKGENIKSRKKQVFKSTVCNNFVTFGFIVLGLVTLLNFA